MAERTSKLFFENIFEHLPDTVFVKEAASLTYERVNRACELLVGVPRAALLGKTDFDVFPVEQAAFFQAKDREALDGGVLVDIPEEPIETRQGTRWLHTKKIPILDADGSPRYLVGISEDITERKLARDELERVHADLERRVEARTHELRRSEQVVRDAQKLEAVGRLAGGVAHDFNNLLTVILTEASAMRGAVDDSLRRGAAAIVDAAQRAAALTRQLLAFSRQQVLRPRDLDLDAVVAGLAPMLRRVIGEHIALAVGTCPGGGWIHADPGQLEQVILNLVVNARDAMPDGGLLRVEVTRQHLTDGRHGLAPGAYVILAVADTGAGMNPETQARVFEPFFTTKVQGRGTGLGLSTVYGIVVQSGGTIAVDSEPGLGSRFEIYFPEVGLGRARAEAPALAAVAAGGDETLLLVEDDEPVRRALFAVLTAAGYNVVQARNGVEAIAMLGAHPGPIDALVSDLVMPSMGGRDLARHGRVLRPRLRVLFISGYAAPEDATLDPGDRFLAKPFEPATLVTCVRELLDAS